jgi:putative thioredoxin
MSQTPVVFDVPPGQFQQQVLQRSLETTVVVDFWAEWCAPCRALGPILEQVVESYGGRAVLAKVNIEEDRQVAVKYGIQSIPAVKVFRDGAVVTEFVGALPAEQVRRVLDSVIPSPASELLAEGDDFATQRDIEGAESRYRRALEMEPGNSGALLRLGTIALERGQRDEARELLGRIEENMPDYAAAQGLLTRLQFQEQQATEGGVAESEKRLAQDPDDLDARYELACALTAEGEYERALPEFLEVVTRDRNYRDQAAKEAMVRIFSIIGPRSELADEYRKKLARVLY